MYWIAGSASLGKPGMGMAVVLGEGEERERGD